MSKKELSLNAELLLRSMRSGQKVLVRATTGRATYSSPGHGEHDCTEALLELYKRKLVGIDSIDKGVGWVTYRSIRLTEKEIGK